MSNNNNLQELFDTFGSGLKKYIQSEVKRQVSQTMDSMDVEEEEAAVVGSDDVAPVSVLEPVVDLSPAHDSLDSISPTLSVESVSTIEKQSYSPGISGLKVLLNRVKKVN